MAASRLSKLTSFLKPKADFEPLPLVRFHTKSEFDQYNKDNEDELARQFEEECKLFKSEEPFLVHAFCYACGRPKDFHVNFLLAHEVRGRRIPGWRDCVFCVKCNLNNRQRAAVHLADVEAHLKEQDNLFLTEQLTDLHREMQRRHPLLTGSEFLGNTVPLGSKDKRGVRNEDLTKLTFADATFDVVMCFDVLEHVPDYLAGIRELARVLKSGGRMVMSVPFESSLVEHRVRARINSDGQLEYLLPPEYHSDPLDPQGCLCFYHFGWSFLDDLKRAGFNDAYVVRYGSMHYGYFGDDPLMFIATKGD